MLSSITAVVVTIAFIAALCALASVMQLKFMPDPRKEQVGPEIERSWHSWRRRRTNWSIFAVLCLLLASATIVFK